MLNVASAAGLFTPPFMGAYNVAKAGRHRALRDASAPSSPAPRSGVTVRLPDLLQDEHREQRPHRRREASARGPTGLVDGGKTAEEVARAAIASVDRGELYALPMADGALALAREARGARLVQRHDGPYRPPGGEVMPSRG